MIRLSLSVYNDVHSLYTKLYAHVANSSFFPVIEPRTTLYSFPPRSFHHRVRFACRNVLKHRRLPLRSNDTVAPKSSSDTRNPLVPRDFDFSLPLAFRSMSAMLPLYLLLFSHVAQLGLVFFYSGRHVFGVESTFR